MRDTPANTRSTKEVIWQGIGGLFFTAMGAGQYWLIWPFLRQLPHVSGKQVAAASFFIFVGIFFLVEGLTLLRVTITGEDREALSERIFAPMRKVTDPIFRMVGRVLGVAIDLSVRVMMFLVLAAVGLLVGALFYLATSSIFEGVDKGTAMIVVLLAGILLAVLNKKDRPVS